MFTERHENCTVTSSAEMVCDGDAMSCHFVLIRGTTMKLVRLNECLLTFSARTVRQEEGAMPVYIERSAFHGVARDAIMESIYVDQTGQDSGKDSDSGLEIDPRAGRST